MPVVDRPRLRLAVVAMTTLLAFSLKAEEPQDLAAYARRGRDVAAANSEYASRFGRYETRLREVLARDAPDLVARLAVAPPIRGGYQRLPRLLPGREAAPAIAPAPISYSWARTQAIIDAEIVKLARDEASLDTASTLAVSDRRPIYEKLVESHGWLVKNRDIAGEHVRHNQFWQQQAAAHPGAFGARVSIVDAVMERHGILSLLAQAPIGATATASLQARLSELDRRIADSIERPATPAYLQYDRAPGRCTIRLPVSTDIADADFLDRAERMIEDTWTAADAAAVFSVDVQFRRVSTAALYHAAATPAPLADAALDVASHVARFAADAAILTTGADRTHAIAGRYVALGPADINGNTLAHEFGHLLGFFDHYVRAARDLGDAGFEIVEIVPDYDDIMAAPGTGRVTPAHFRRLTAKACSM